MKHHGDGLPIRRGIAFICLLTVCGMAQAFDHSTWNTLLEDHVRWIRGGVASVVDYQGIAADVEKLNRYLASLSAVSRKTFNSFTQDEKLAFLINAYNAFTVKLILKQDGLPESIRNIGGFFSGPWDQQFFTLLGKKRTLDELEQQMIRGNPNLMDPRIHFALNCASVGCPALRPEAYTAGQLDEQLTDAARRYLSDNRRNRYQSESNTLAVSSIFDWYREDFVQAAGSLGKYLARYADALGVPEDKRDALRAGEIPIEFLDYDWSLNALRATD